MNIVLLGYRGAGKSVVSKYLARKLKRKIYRTDEMIVRLAGMSIPEIVREKGWDEFRRLEAQVVADVCQQARNSVIDCGGGVILNDENILKLKEGGKAVLLMASFATLLERIREDPNRPALKNGVTFEEEQRQILAEREDKYRAAADVVCDTTVKKPMDTVFEIINHCKKNRWI